MEIIIYLVLAYWAAGKTVYRNRIMIGTANGIFLQRLMIGAIFGIVLIPLAILMALANLLKK